MSQRLLILQSFAYLFFLSSLLFSEDYHIYLDADQTQGRGLNSSISIQRGLEVALAENDNKLNGYSVKLILKNHRGSSPRSKRNIKDFIDDPKALSIFGGMHSPPILANKDFINENSILYFVPWAAAGPITRSNQEENFIFRLSIDDSKAGSFISNYSKKEGFKRPYLLLEDTGWGKSNHQTMSQSLSDLSITPAGLSWFNWGIGDAHAKLLMREIIQSKADVIFLVCNAPEGETLLKALYDLSPASPIAIRSHWGITGGNFYDELGSDVLSNLNLKFIQTNFSLLNHQKTPFQNNVFSNLRKLDKTIQKPSQLKAPSGFIHAYDLMTLFIQAANKSNLTGNAKTDALKIKTSLYKLNKSQGLLKEYISPFRPNDDKNIDGHEALTSKDYTMGHFNKLGIIELD